MIENSFFGDGAQFHHVGVAVKSIKEVSQSSNATADPTQGVSVAFVRVHGVVLELIEPSTDDSPISADLAKGVKLLHLCFSVPDLELCQNQERAIAHCYYHRVNIVWLFVESHRQVLRWVGTIAAGS